MNAFLLMGVGLGVAVVDRDDSIRWGPLDLHPTVAADGIVYTSTGGAYNASIVAINPDGTTKWKHKFDPISNAVAPDYNAIAPPTLSNDGAIVYVAGTDGFLYAMNTANGAVEWKYQSYANTNMDRWCYDDVMDVVCPIFSQVIVDEVGNIFFQGAQTLSKLSPRFGAGGNGNFQEILWVQYLDEYFGDSTDEYGYVQSNDFFRSTHMELSDGTLYMRSLKHVLAVDASSGHLLWSQPAGSRGDAPLMASNGQLYGYSRNVSEYDYPGTEDGSDFVTVNASNLTVLRHFDEAGDAHVAIQDDTIFVSTSSSVHAMHTDGTEKWVWSLYNYTQIEEYELSAPVVCGDVLYVGTVGSPELEVQRGTLQALNVSTGAPLWSVSPNFTSPYYDCDSCLEGSSCHFFWSDWDECCEFCYHNHATTPSCSPDNEVIYFGAVGQFQMVLTSAISRNGSVLWSYSDWDLPIVV